MAQTLYQIYRRTNWLYWKTTRWPPLFREEVNNHPHLVYYRELIMVLYQVRKIWKLNNHTYFNTCLTSLSCRLIKYQPCIWGEKYELLFEVMVRPGCSISPKFKAILEIIGFFEVTIPLSNQNCIRFWGGEVVTFGQAKNGKFSKNAIKL